MMIGVMLKGALKNGAIAIVPLETSWVQPNIDSIREVCDKELKAIYPFDFAISYEIISIEHVIAKICQN